VAVEQHHAQELATGMAVLAETWDEFVQRQPPLDDASEERKAERQRERQRGEERQRELQGELDAMTLEDVWPIVNKAWLRRRRDRCVVRLHAAAPGTRSH